MTRPSVPMLALLLLAVGGAAGYGYYRIKTSPERAAPPPPQPPGVLRDPFDGGPRASASDAGPGDVIEVMPFDGALLDAAGARDFGNRYFSTVIVSLEEPSEGADCSGVIIGPRQVLTAAHCVCKPGRSSSGSPIPLAVDGTHCPKQAYASTVRYGAIRNKQVADSELLIYKGSVRPHPDFKMVFAPDGTVSSVKADLAMIVLDNPLMGGLPPMPSLTDEELQRQETLVMAGYGHGGDWGGGYHRYFRSNKVIGPEGSSQERFVYEQQGAHLYSGFDGGPCFREQGTHWELAGIASVGSDKALTLTSTFAHRAWIRSETQRPSP